MAEEIKDVVELARRLIAIESTTGDESAVANFLYRYLTHLGWRVERLAVAANRWNVFAQKGSPQIVFSTHMDTVPPFFSPAEDHAFLYGRGACDAKGILAAQVFAADGLLREGFDGVCLLFVVGEERNSAGAIAANQWVQEQPFAYKIRYLINGEPTQNRLALGTKGSLRCLLEARGQAAHSAYPELGENAIEKLLQALNRIRGLPLRKDPELGEETINIGTITGGTGPNIVPSGASAEVMFRLVSDSAPLKRALLAELGSLVEVQFQFEVPRVRLKRLDGFESAPMAYTTDIPFLANFGEPLLIGPGSIHDAHTPGEKISKGELIRGVELYVQLTRRLLKEA
ncbi:MAG: M20/M25/M40 family metallo-hydrolase [Acidobacteria bacterium]|nr:M20/M25/M40 family metallo-hydrolase [Acidobacteriota bacterium]